LARAVASATRAETIAVDGSRLEDEADLMDRVRLDDRHRAQLLRQSQGFGELVGHHGRPAVAADMRNSTMSDSQHRAGGRIRLGALRGAGRPKAEAEGRHRAACARS
jgi:hypothetical protein